MLSIVMISPGVGMWGDRDCSGKAGQRNLSGDSETIPPLTGSLCPHLPENPCSPLLVYMLIL